LNSFTDETYFLHPIIMAEAVDYIINLPNQLEIQQEITKQVKLQEQTKQMEEQTKQLQEKTKQINMQEKTKQLEEKNKSLLLKIELLKLKKIKN